MSTEVTIPALGESISSGVLSSWKVPDGSYVEVDQPIYELETDKITQEGLAEISGIITFLVKEGEEVDIGATIAKIDESAEKKGETEIMEPEIALDKEPGVDATDNTNQEIENQTACMPESEPVSVEKETEDSPAPITEKKDVPLSPAVRKILAETNLDPSTIKGTGKDGRITKADVLDAKKSVSITETKDETEHLSKAVKKETPSSESRTTRRSLSPIRRKIASRLVEAQQTAAILSTFNEVDLTEVMALRKRHQESFVKQHEVKLGFMSFFVKGVVHALRAVPQINSRLEGDELVENHYFDIGVAVGTDKGLVVPVLRDCDQLSFAEIEKSIVDYAKKARSGGITLQDMQGGCFTITNGGIYGSLLSTPILNPPQSGILGMHSIQERPIALNGEVVIRPMMYIALSYDHRVVDGKEAVTFLVKLKEAMEDPARLALGI